MRRRDVCIMFTIDQIKAAHSKVKSGADFPNYVNELRELGVTSYINHVSDGHTEYDGTNRVSGEAKYEEKIIAATGDKSNLESALKIHQSGGSDYLTFCSQAAEAGVNTWVVDLNEMTCTYFDKADNVMVIEKIPA